MDVSASGAKIEAIIIRAVDVVVRIEIQLRMNALSQLSASEYHLGTLLALFLSNLDECRIHIRCLIDLASCATDQIDVGSKGNSIRSARSNIIRLLLLDLGDLKLDMDLLCCRSCCEKTRNLVVAFFFCLL